jgi:hypothetical protein
MSIRSTSLLDGSQRSGLHWGVLSSLSVLKPEFNDKYREFEIVTEPERRCRLLLDLFKLKFPSSPSFTRHGEGASAATPMDGPNIVGKPG